MQDTPEKPTDVTETTTPVAHVSQLSVFGLPPFWCIVTCPTCDAAGYIQEDVHPLPPTTSTKCAHGHAYRIELGEETENLDYLLDS
jgi:hypothetical protein